MNLTPVGIVRSGIVDRQSMPPLGAPARVEIYPQFEDGLLRFEKHSHIWVMAWLDAGERGVLQVKPRGMRGDGPETMHGVFAVRSPARPNPIGLTAARVTRTEGRLIHVDRLDFLDGTAVLDIKPYFVSRDCIFSATNIQIGKPASREAMRESLLMQAANFCGAANPDVALAVRILEHFRAVYWDLDEPELLAVIVPEGRPWVLNAVMGMTRLTTCSGRLGTRPSNSVFLAARQGQPIWAATYHLAMPLPDSAEEVLAWADDRLFHVERGTMPSPPDAE